jgi:type III pantothenate kinase
LFFCIKSYLAITFFIILGFHPHCKKTNDMSVNLCIDWGNSRVKAGIFDNDGKAIETANFSDSEASSSISSLIDTYKPVKGIMSTVVNGTSEVENLMSGHMKAFMKLDYNTRVPVMNAYAGESLGADRLGLAVAAHILHPDKNNLVIGLGTCITYNFVQKNKAFRGGAISPGLQMRLDAMHEFTNRLPKVKADGELLLLGYDTETCMRSGAVYGMAAEIDGMINEFSSQYPDFNAILTGGDTAFFASKLKSKIFADPDLLLKGLNIILTYNVPHVR